MSSNGEIVDLVLEIEADEDEDADELDRITRALLDELRNLDVESVDLVKKGAAPRGAKSAEAIDVGALVIKYGPAAAAILREVLEGWSKRNKGRKIKFKRTIAGKVLEVKYTPEKGSVLDLSNLVITVKDAPKRKSKRRKKSSTKRKTRK